MIFRLARGALRGVIAAMAMTGMRRVTRDVGLVHEPPPDAILRRRLGWLLRTVPRKRRAAAVEITHWTYGAGGGVAFAALPDELRKIPWAGPLYGLLVWLAFELAIAPGLGLKHARGVRLAERSMLAADHLLYGLVLNQTRRQTGD